MFAWAGSKFDAVLNGYVLGVVTTLAAAITPIALTAMTLWIALYGWAVVRGEAPEPVPAFVWKVFKIGLVLALSLQSGFYIANIAETANALSMGVAATFVPADIPASTVSTPYELLDKFNDEASSQTADLMKEASMFRLDLLLAAVIFSFGSVLFLCIALFVVTLSKLMLTFVIAVGPMFILCLAWRPTARFFDSWLSMLLNAVVLSWFAFFALGLSNYMGLAIFQAINDGGGFLGGTFNVLGESTRYCVLMTLMAIICLQAPSLASALTGGVAIQQGIQMIQNMRVISGYRSGNRVTHGGNAARASGRVDSHANGTGYTVGRATGTAVAAMRGFARTPAYKLAARRGQI
ncbi:type IV secretion system protein [Pelomonas parva]|uniref:Type IV secretion system protein n=1 Tax=Pelomonas parva TaxID=3299032 RepID=A0ABW7F867_9BURK